MTAEHNHPPRCCCLDPNDDTGQGAAGRCPGCPEHGTFAREGITCPQCHQTAGRPHTDYCTLAPGRVWDGALNTGDRVLVDTGALFASVPARPCSNPAGNHGDGRGCETDDCPRHSEPGPRLVCRRCNGYGLIVVNGAGHRSPCPDCKP